MNSHKRDEYKRKIAEQKQEIAELMAHVERLRLVAEMVSANRFLDYEFAYKVLDETPAQSLQQIKRNAVLDALKHVDPNNESEDRVYNQIEEHANNLVKGGE